MLIFDKRELAVKAKKLGVVRDTLEKVLRLSLILKFLSTSNLFKNSLALKGGTAINLLFFDLPRLSVDIDLDFCNDSSRDDMLSYREKLTKIFLKFMLSQGYILSIKSKNYHSLDSFVFEYINSGNTKDNIKIEINYSLRKHVLPLMHIPFKSNIIEDHFEVVTVNPIEIYATKTVALLTRGAARDLYDLNYMIKKKLLKCDDLELYRKCIIFYFAISTEEPIMKICFDSIDNITQHNVFTSLLPVIRDKDTFKLEEAKREVKFFINSYVYIKRNDLEFLKEFQNGYYKPELLFDNEIYLNNIYNHPMAIWKTSKR